MKKNMKNMNDTNNEFYEKNDDVFKMLDTLIENNIDDIRYIITSPETKYLLGHSDKGKVTSEEFSTMDYNGISILTDVYSPIRRIEVVWKGTMNTYNLK